MPIPALTHLDDSIAERRLAARHEAGHATAATMRGGASPTSVTISAEHPGSGLTVFRHLPWDHAFVAYAGPWAEARADWPLDTSDGLLDAEGSLFADRVMGVLLQQPEDAEVVYAYEQELAANAALMGVDRLALTPISVVWDTELERAWPRVKELASRLEAEASTTRASSQPVRVGGPNKLTN